MATIRIPFADTPMATPNPGAGQMRADLRPSLRDGGAGQMSPNVGRREAALIDPRAGRVDPNAASAEARAEFAAARETGQAALQAGGALARMAEAEQQLQTQTDISQSRVRFMRGLGEIEADMGTRDIRDSTAAREEFSRRAGELRDSIAGNLGGRARDLFPAMADEMAIPREFNVGRDAFQRGAQASIASLQEELRETANGAAAARNPVERAQLLEAGEAAVAARVAAGVLNPDAAARLARGFRQDVQQADVTRLMGTNPAAAIALLNDTRQTPDIDADRRAALVNQALNRQDAMAARAEAAMARRERQVASAVQEFDGLLSQGIVPAARADAVLAMARGTPLEPRVRQLIEDSRAVSAFSMASLPEQRRILEEADARRRGPNATDVDQANFARLATIQANQIQGFQQDGLGFAVRLGTVEPQPPINWTDPATLQSRVAAAAGESARRGYAISPFNREDLAAGVQQFERGTPEQRLALVQAIGSVDDPQVRAAAFQHFERARGTGGNMPAGTLVRVYDMLRSGTIEGQQSARRIINDLSVPVEGRTRQAGEGPEMNAALVAARSSGVLAARIAAAQVAGGGAFASLVRRDEETLQHAAAARMTAGASSASAAVREAQADWERGLAVVNDRNLAHVYFPADRANPAQVTTGLRLLREEAGRVDLNPAAGLDANMQARARRDAAASAVWINEGSSFALVARGQAGAPVVLRTATLDEVTGAATTRARQDAATPPVMRREQALEQERRDQRRMPPAPVLQ
jgi:hypothetical protein